MGSFTAKGKYLYIISMAFTSNMSLSSHAAFVMSPSTAWVMASIPVAAVRLLGNEYISSASMMATQGMSLGSTQTIFAWRDSSMMT